ACGHQHIHLTGFLEDMASAYAAADVVITSAGALSLAELASVRKPAVLFPNPDVTADHQRFNAEAFARAGAALTTRDPEAALHLALDLMPDPQRRADLASAMGALAAPDAAERLVDEIVRLASD
ncbi:MAG: glycosyltransferase, partial [Planctomycetota bacterium]